ncbi:13433_t:CDS:2 [Racocetra fulgida]|uniref:13433_t:CDS:1 n=1 Tax=Racocetra fulgida TaxID=60492 RepID=A0A9N9B4V2_9GLOM|nr:13433_t:CDS:2 [Racocetra fulgida]
MIKIVESKEIIKNSINLIWKATEGNVVTVTFNRQLRLATISLDNGINTTLNLEAPRAALIKEDISSKIINKHAGSIMIEDIPKENISDEGSDDDLPGWSECEECYGPKKEFCDLCGCSVYKWKGDQGHILLCDGYCGKGFHTRKLKQKTQSDDSSSSDNAKKIKKSNRKRKLLLDRNESTDDEVVNDRQSTKISKTNFKKASLQHNSEATDNIMNNPEESINDYEDGEKHMVRCDKKRESPSNCSEKYKKKARLNLPRSLKEKERMRHSSSETESDEYVDLLKKIRRVKGITENFVSHDPEKIFEMLTQPIHKYFNADFSEASLEPEQFPKIIEDIQGCFKYLAIWDSYFNNCKRLIGIQDYKMLKLVYSLTDVFFIMLKICYQEQVKDTSGGILNRE